MAGCALLTSTFSTVDVTLLCALLVRSFLASLGPSDMSLVADSDEWFGDGSCLISAAEAFWMSMGGFFSSVSVCGGFSILIRASGFP